MSEPVGETFIRVRPNTTGFQSEASTALKGPLLSLGKLVAGAFTIKAGFDLGKGIIEDAARVQKSSETIRAEFGKAGAAVIDFADTTGVKLGIASHVSEDTAARFGVLFRNIGVGKGQAAEMTTNLEKLAGSIAAIQGKDPGQILGTLPLALSGSLRGLRQLGFAFTPVQVKNEALALGLIRTTKQALDPGARALAIYGLVTQHLGDYQAQAAGHANDAYNIQKRLSAEWDHAKETLGLSLLPQVAKYGTELSDWIDKGTRSGQIQRDINRASTIGKEVIGDVAAAVHDAKGAYGDFARLVGGDHNAVKILADAFLLLYARSKLIKWGLISSGEKLVGDTALTSAGKVGVLEGALGKLKRLGPIAIAIALDFIPKAKPNPDKNAVSNSGVAKAFDKAPLLGPLFSQANRLGDAINKEVDKLRGIGGAPALGKPGFDSPFLHETFAQAKLTNPRLTRKQFDLAQQIAVAIRFAPKDPAVKKSAADAGADIGKSVATSTHDALAKSKGNLAAATLTNLKAAAATANRFAAEELRNAQYEVTQAKETLQQAISDGKKAVADSITQAKQNLNSIASSIAGDASKPGVGPLGGVLTGRLKELMGLVQSGKASPQAVSIAQELQDQLVAKQSLPQDSSVIERRLADLADLFNKGAINVKTADLRLDKILKSAGVTATVIQRTQGVAAADKFRADVQAFRDQIKATAAAPKQAGTGLEVAIVKPLEVLRDSQRTIARDAHDVALRQLDVQKAAVSQQRLIVSEAKKQSAALAKIEAKLPSKHDSAELERLLKKQESETAAAARRRARNRHH